MELNKTDEQTKPERFIDTEKKLVVARGRREDLGEIGIGDQGEQTSTCKINIRESNVECREYH